MKTLLFLSKLIILFVVMGYGLSSCEQRAPDITKKEIDTRLIGTWSIIEQDDTEIHPKDKTIVFKPDGTCLGFHYPGGKRMFYTEGNNHLFIFVHGTGLKLSNWTYESYYKIVSDKLIIWGSKEDMIAEKYESATSYHKTPK